MTTLRARLHTLAPGSFQIERSPMHDVSLHVGAAHPLYERFDGLVRETQHRARDIVVIAAGEPRQMRWSRPTSFVRVTLDPRFVRGVADSMEGARATLRGTTSRRHPALERVLRGIAHVLSSVEAGPGGRPALDPLVEEIAATEIAAHLVDLDRGFAPDPRALSKRRLDRVLELVRARFADGLTLAEMAAVAGLSPFHFARAFRHAVGRAPHQYVVGARVDEARRLLLQGVRPADAAIRAGFHSQGHLTRHMRRVLGVTPAALRRT
ncbi:MAG: AraC family transcriptional regulator [Polyangiaceae bacterium]